MKSREIGVSRMLFVKLEPNDDILESLTRVAKESQIKTGFFTAIGAINQANIGYYLMDKKTYKTITLIDDFEIVSCTGNITSMDNAPVIHAHLVIADKEGNAFGGHLLPGCRISVTGEVFILEAEQALTRKLEDPFQLALINLK